MAFPETIETARMILRPYRPQDMKDHVGILSIWEVTRWLSTNIPFPYMPADGRKFIGEAMAQFASGTSIRYAVTHKATGRHIGGIRVFSVTAETEVGYWMHPDFWGRGFGGEVLKVVVDTGLEAGVIGCFVAQTARDNIPSRHLLEKVGFTHEATIPKYYRRGSHGDGSNEFYRLTYERWKNK